VWVDMLLRDIDFRTIVTSHIDVVPPHIPYSVSGNTIYGRGSNDAKGSVATQIQAVEELRKSGKISDGDVAMLFVVGEEVHPPAVLGFFPLIPRPLVCLGCGWTMFMVG